MDYYALLILQDSDGKRASASDIFTVTAANARNVTRKVIERQLREDIAAAGGPHWLITTVISFTVERNDLPFE